jgi:hypothetical protein
MKITLETTAAALCEIGLAMQDILGKAATRHWLKLCQGRPAEFATMDLRRDLLTLGTILSVAFLASVVSYFAAAYAFNRFMEIWLVTHDAPLWTVARTGVVTSMFVAAIVFGLVCWYLVRKLVSQLHRR